MCGHPRSRPFSLERQQNRSLALHEYDAFKTLHLRRLLFMARRDGAIRRESLTPTRNLRRNSRDDGAHRTPSTRHTSRRALKDLSQLHRTTARATPHPRSSPCRRRKPHKNLPANRHARHRRLAILPRHPRPHIIRTPRNRPPLPHPQLLVDLARPRIPTAQSRQHHRGAHA